MSASGQDKEVLRGEQIISHLRETGVQRALTPGQWQVLKQVAFWTGNSNGYCYARHTKIAEKVGLTREGVSKALVKLVSMGLVIRQDGERNNGNNHNLYFLNLRQCDIEAEQFRAKLNERKAARGAKVKAGKKKAARERAAKERAALRAEVLAEAHNELGAARAETEAARERAAREIVIADALRAETDAAQSERSTLRAETDAAQSELDTARAEADAVLTAARAEADAVLAAARAEADAVLAAAKAETEAAQSERDTARAEADFATLTGNEILARFDGAGDRILFIKGVINSLYPDATVNGNFNMGALMQVTGKGPRGVLEAIHTQYKIDADPLKALHNRIRHGVN